MRQEAKSARVDIALITLRYLQRKGGKGSSNPLFFQLLMASGGPFGGARREKNLHLRLGEYHGAHIAPVRHQTGGYGKAPLALQERGANRRQGGDLGGVIARFLGPNGAGDVLSVQPDDFLAGGRRNRSVCRTLPAKSGQRRPIVETRPPPAGPPGRPTGTAHRCRAMPSRALVRQRG